jgi:L-fuculose-phosphate aldolase
MAECYKRGLITTRDGNAAISRGDCFYITPSGVRKGVIRVEDLIKYKIKDGKFHPVKKGLDPSIEFNMHADLHLLKKTNYLATLHVHPTNVVAALLSGFDLQKIYTVFPELNRYTKVGKTVDVYYPGDEKLASTTVANMINPDGGFYDIVGQKGHGVFIQANNPWSCFEHLERLEHACEMILKSRLSPEDL